MHRIINHRTTPILAGLLLIGTWIHTGCKEASDLSRNELRGNVKSVVTHYYAWSELDKTDATQITRSEELHFDAQGHLLTYQYENSDTTLIFGSEQFAATWRFNSEGWLTQVSAKGLQYEVVNDTILHRTTVYERADSSQNICAIYNLEYNDRQQLVRCELSDVEGRKIMTRQWRYHPNGCIKEEIAEEPSDWFPLLTKKVYDKKGNIIKRYDLIGRFCIEYEPQQGDSIFILQHYTLPEYKKMSPPINDDGTSGRVELSRRFDNQGNWIYQELRNYAENKRVITRRTITYYTTKTDKQPSEQAEKRR